MNKIFLVVTCLYIAFWIAVTIVLSDSAGEAFRSLGLFVLGAAISYGVMFTLFHARIDKK